MEITRFSHLLALRRQGLPIQVFNTFILPRDDKHFEWMSPKNLLALVAVHQNRALAAFTQVCHLESEALEEKNKLNSQILELKRSNADLLQKLSSVLDRTNRLQDNLEQTRRKMSALEKEL